MGRVESEIMNNLAGIINRYRDATDEETARAIYASVVPSIVDGIRPEVKREERQRLIDAGWREPEDLDHLTRTTLIEVAIREQTKKLIEFPSTQYTENNVSNLCESLKALEISKRIDRETKEGTDD